MIFCIRVFFVTEKKWKMKSLEINALGVERWWKEKDKIGFRQSFLRSNLLESIPAKTIKNHFSKNNGHAQSKLYFALDASPIIGQYDYAMMLCLEHL